MTAPTFNSVAWFEFGTDQPEKVQEFYGELFDWKYVLNTNTPGVTYHSVMAPGAPQVSGGVWDSQGGFPNYAIFYVLVQDVAATVKRGKDLGAEVLMEPVSDSAGFTFARLRDTAGNHFGVFSAPAP
ncbi:VOC family protein [Streptomyces turgidiscabies]|uniref:Glyoxalase family protein n=1 Tax=Streptomyces turgidiscabies (strain Car8) TaxID=698760 RepID=L7FBD2_STRT8|nr:MULTISPECIES: VOC family protein [Streptomyces]ELP68557.1 glyoxalase family protein [Streptomyces turgidiscabies Car8]MDX3494086.1 VOC family protein [Streptomyces turgidiscabies]GAQ68543.1 glyoxalase-like domain protein [Streptomyces turgidiscabies]